MKFGRFAEGVSRLRSPMILGVDVGVWASVQASVATFGELVETGEPRWELRGRGFLIVAPDRVLSSWYEVTSKRSSRMRLRLQSYHIGEGELIQQLLKYKLWTFTR